MSRKQCKKCPWRVGANPREIPNGYDEEEHRRLSGTIASPGSGEGIGQLLQIMACHETPVGSELPCVGWLVHQLNQGDSIPLRLAVMLGRIDADVVTEGPQHERFEDTLPRDQDV